MRKELKCEKLTDEVGDGHKVMSIPPKDLWSQSDVNTSQGPLVQVTKSFCVEFPQSFITHIKTAD